MEFAICDDDLAYAEELKKAIVSYYCAENVTIETFASEKPLLRELGSNRQRFDAIFLDILIAGANGVEVARSLRDNGLRMPIVLVSSSREFMGEGYFVDALAYLVKPLDNNELARALDKLGNVQRQSEWKFLVVKSDREDIRVPFAEITTIERAGRKTVVKLINKVNVYTNQPISALEEQIRRQDGFVICNHANYINTDNIQKYEKSSLKFNMKDSSVVYAARAHMREIIDVYLRGRGGAS